MSLVWMRVIVDNIIIHSGRTRARYASCSVDGAEGGYEVEVEQSTLSPETPRKARKRGLILTIDRRWNGNS